MILVQNQWKVIVNCMKMVQTICVWVGRLVVLDARKTVHTFQMEREGVHINVLPKICRNSQQLLQFLRVLSI